MKFILPALFLLILGCRSAPGLSTQPSTLSISSFNYDDFLNNLDSVNTKMRSEVFLEKQDLTKFTQKTYDELLNGYKSTIALSTAKELKKFKYTVRSGYKKTFIFCAYSDELNLSLCDDTRCMHIEAHILSEKDETERLATKLPLKKCL